MLLFRGKAFLLFLLVLLFSLCPLEARLDPISLANSMASRCSDVFLEGGGPFFSIVLSSCPLQTDVFSPAICSIFVFGLDLIRNSLEFAGICQFCPLSVLGSPVLSTPVLLTPVRRCCPPQNTAQMSPGAIFFALPSHPPPLVEASIPSALWPGPCKH